MNKQFWLAVGAYLVPTFSLGYYWRLVIFGEQYHRLDVYRADVIIPFGFASMLIQAVLFARLYPRLFKNIGAWNGAIRIDLLFGLLSWAYTALPIAAKYQMRSIADFMWLESGFTLLQFLVVSPLIALAYHAGRRV